MLLPEETTSLGHVPIWALLTLASALLLYVRAGYGRLASLSAALLFAFALAVAKEFSDAAIDSAYVGFAGYEVNLAGASDPADIVLDLIGMALAAPVFLSMSLFVVQSHLPAMARSRARRR